MAPQPIQKMTGSPEGTVAAQRLCSYPGLVAAFTTSCNEGAKWKQLVLDNSLLPVL